MISLASFEHTIIIEILIIITEEQKEDGKL